MTRDLSGFSTRFLHRGYTNFRLGIFKYLSGLSRKEGGGGEVTREKGREGERDGKVGVEPYGSSLYIPYVEPS